MEPFRITCTTCKARLKVRSAELVGHILACPRCQSMVQIVAPTDESPAADPSRTATGTNSHLSDSSITESVDASFDAIPEMLAGVAVPAKPDSNSGDQPGETIEQPLPGKTPATPVAQAADTKNASPKKEKVAAAAAVAAMAPHEMTDAAPVADAPVADASAASSGWTSPTEQLWQKIALWGTAGGAGLFLVGGLVGMWIANSGETESDPANTVATSDAEGESSNTTQEPNSPTDEASDSTAREEQVSADGNENEDARDNADTPAVTKSEKSPASDSANSLTENQEADESTPGKPIAGAQLAGAGENTPSSASPENIENPPATEADGTVAAVDAANAEGPEVPVTDVPAPAVEKLAAIRHDPRPSEEWVPVDVTKQFDHKLPRVSFQSVAMIDVVNFVSQAANVPITVDADALEIYGVSPSASVTFEKDNVKLSEVLRAALRPFELSYLEGEGQIRIVNPKLRDKSYRHYKLPIEDLTDDSTSEAAELVAQIKRLVAPESWDIAKGPGTLEAVADNMSIAQTVPIRYQVLAYCERLRLARGLARKSRLPADRFSLVSGRTQAEKSLRRPITFTFHNPTPLPQVTRFLEQSTGQTILIDWQSLIRSGFTPATKVSCAIVDQPLDEALTAILTPLRLGWRSLNAQTIQIISLADSQTSRELVFYPVSPWIGRGYDEARLERVVTTAASSVDPAHASQVSVALDKPSHRLIVLANQESQRNIAAALSAEQD